MLSSPRNVLFGFAGFLVAGLGAFYVFLKDAKLWERRQLRERGRDPDTEPRHHRGPEWRPPRGSAPEVDPEATPRAEERA